MAGKKSVNESVTLHFILMDILASAGEAMSVSEITEKIDEYLLTFPEPRLFDESTVRKKLKEYVSEGILSAEKQGRILYYQRPSDPDYCDTDILDYFSEVSPCGVTGSFLLDQEGRHKDPFAFKHHYITGAMDSEIVCRLLMAMGEKRKITLETINRHKDRISESHGMNVWEGRMERFDLTELRCYRSLRDTKRLERSLGTLGGGNHFIEIDRSSDGIFYLVIHSGSRNLGKQVAEIYQQLAIDLHMGKEDYFRQRDELIRTYKAAGRRSEIQGALKELQKNYDTHSLNVPEDSCWLYGPFLDDYLHDVEICQRFARRSRERMAEIILERSGMSAAESFHTIHNYIDTQEMILRKGAIAAHEGEKILIPINMRDGSVLAVGKGNPEWNYSAPHGAGRIMSRSKAKESLDMEAYKAAMQGIYTTSVQH